MVDVHMHAHKYSFSAYWMHTAHSLMYGAWFAKVALTYVASGIRIVRPMCERHHGPFAAESSSVHHRKVLELNRCIPLCAYMSSALLHDVAGYDIFFCSPEVIANLKAVPLCAGGSHRL